MIYPLNINTDIYHLPCTRRWKITSTNYWLVELSDCATPLYEEVRDHIHQLLASGVTRQSYSPWTSNVVMCQQKDVNLRMCVDYRRWNTNTIKDAHELPQTEEISWKKYFNHWYEIRIPLDRISTIRRT